MPLLNITADFASLVRVLTRIADALDRAIPPTANHPLPTPATLSDLHHTSDYETDVQRSLVQFAHREGIASTTSPLFRKRMIEYESFIRNEFGEEAIESLPWNKDGRIFTERTQEDPELPANFAEQATDEEDD